MLVVAVAPGERMAEARDQRTGVTTGAQILTDSGFALLKGKRVGLITNQTGRVGAQHLADLMAKTPGVRLTAILAPEHGFRGLAEAGAHVRDGVDTATGVPVLSLYGATRKPTRAMLRNIDVLVFDIQDIGVRFYTYISTMGLAMQAAAEAGISFVVLDRPNPLGGDAVAGFLREPGLSTFVGQYPIPIVHGLTVGELAHMIKGERWLPGLSSLDLKVVAMTGWRRDMRWPRTRLDWVATSPNIPTFASALAYPGIGIVGELAVNEGRGTATPFTRFGAAWLDAQGAAARLNAAGLPGVRFEAQRYTPRPIPNVATDPQFANTEIPGVRLLVTDMDRYQPLEAGIHALVEVVAQARQRKRVRLFKNLAMFHAIAGTKRLHRMLTAGRSGDEIIAAWAADVAGFDAARKRYLLY